MFAFSFLKKTLPMKQNISLQELIAINNPSRAKALVVKYGYRPARNYNDLIQKLFRLTKEHREDALKDLVDIHPHKDLIIHYAMPMPIPVATETKSNANGYNTSDCQCPSCQLARVKMYSNFEGTENTPAPKNSTNSDWKSMLPLIAITSLVTAIMVTTIRRIG
jgi:hypothetical protein